MYSTTKTKAAKYHTIKGIEDMVPSLWSPVKQLYKFKEGDFPRLNLRDIEDLLLFLAQKKLSNLEKDVIFDLNVEMWMVLHDIASSLEMDYLPKIRWNKLDRKRSRIMIKATDQQLFERRLMRNLEKFVGGREYGEDFRLLERTI
ncbi:hypothetical protein Tco_0920267 [Tanacetum coccineum]